MKLQTEPHGTPLVATRSAAADPIRLRALPIAVLIPAYRPNHSVIDVVRGLAGHGIAIVVVVDDGSGPEYQHIFDTLAAIDSVRVQRHGVNLGKGAALKTGMNYILAEFGDLAGVVTADADGQHHPDDIVAVCERFAASPNSLVLGARGFAGDIPLRSRFGNGLTRRVMRLVLGQRLTDTQTGLRAIPRSLIVRLLKVPASGYDFELEMLIAAKHQAIAIVEEPIRTIYEPGNPTSHFQPLRDSMRIYFVLMRFSLISLMTAALDNLTFYLVFHATGTIAGAQLAARTAAVLFNYPTVRRAVFFSDQKHSVLLPRYLALVAANALISYTGIRALTAISPIGVFPAKILAETLLFIANFAIQRDFIFTRRPTAVPAPSGIEPCEP
jgi:glycosyltransferase involved in cell wall biosynthesis